MPVTFDLLKVQSSLIMQVTPFEIVLISLITHMLICYETDLKEFGQNQYSSFLSRNKFHILNFNFEIKR